MLIKELWPVIIPGVLVQILIQAFYIRHCWKNTQLSIRKKWSYILAIAVFSLPAAAIYLIYHPEKAAIYDHDFKNIDIDSNVRQGIFLLLIVAFEIFALRVIADNIQNTYYLLIVSLLAYCFVIVCSAGCTDASYKGMCN